jgi:hypothetical protein
MKTRGGWSETSTHKHTGAANGDPIEVESCGRLPGHRQWRHNWIRIAGVEIVSTRRGINTGTATRAPDAELK